MLKKRLIAGVAACLMAVSAYADSNPYQYAALTLNWEP